MQQKPQHIAFIMDGNGRWATERGKPRTYGHREGVRALEKVVRACRDLQIRVCSVYAFSTENWKRPRSEIDALFDMLRENITKIDDYDKYDIRVTVMGDLTALPSDLQASITKLVEATQSHQSYIFNIGINYGGRSEIVHAVNKILKSGCTSITQEDLQKALYTADLPDPDIIVRTGGERRLSNFMLYQSAYAEFYYTDLYWPDMNKKEVEKIIEWFSMRKRRFGALESQ